VLDVRELKIDRSFVADLAHDPTDRALCAAIIGMAHDLGLGVVAEGIEDAAAMEVLRDLGCEVGQGRWFAGPVPAAVLPTTVAEIQGRLADRTVTRLQDRVQRPPR
jgi:EAL domain-containing protein (putative c-di-GMP-specific phosphodiesterase class I)